MLLAKILLGWTAASVVVAPLVGRMLAMADARLTAAGRSQGRLAPAPARVDRPASGLGPLAT